MRIIGIDPGLQVTGYGVIDYDRGRLTLVEGGLIETDSKADLGCRLDALYRGVQAVVRQTRPHVAVVERLYSKYRHPQTALLMAHARGAVLLGLQHWKVEVVSYTASMVKRALVGHGRASKRQIAGMVAQMLGVRIEEISDHVSDALALAISHATPWAQATISSGVLVAKRGMSGLPRRKA
jgi:crossover junction endodeoxyribonuclease RuvC